MTKLQKFAQVSSNVESRTRSNEFIGACRYLLQARGRHEAAEIAERGNATRGVVEILRSAVDHGTTTDADFASPLTPYSSAFAQTLVGLNAFDTILAANAFQQNAAKNRITSVVVGASGDVVAESVAKPISRFTLGQATLEPSKTTCIVVVTDEVAKLAGAAAFAWLSDQMRNGLARATDLKFVADARAATATASRRRARR